MKEKMEGDNDKPEVKCMQIQAHLKLMQEVIDEIWKTKNYTSLRERFYYTIFLKIYYILDGIHINIYNLDNKPHYGMVSVLALRTAMLDILNLYYVMDVHEHQQVADSRVRLIMFDHIRNVFKSLSKEEKVRLAQFWPEFFNADLTLVDQGRINVKIMLNGIVNTENLVNEAADANYIYQLFSKYEHNGAFTFDIIYNPYQNGGNKMEIYMIYYAISICAIATRMIASHWIVCGTPLAEKIDNTTKKLTIFSSPKRRSES